MIITTASPTIIYEHPTTGSTLLPHLLPHLPTSISLTRRIQFHGRTPDSHILASFPPETSTTPKHFVAAYCDRSRAPETEVWLFTSLELEKNRTAEEHEENIRICTEQLLSLFRYIKSLPEPPNPRDNNPQLILVGAVHARTLEPLKRTGIVPWHTPPNQKFVFQRHILPQSDLPPVKPLPKGFIFGEVRREDYPLVQSRTSITRLERTLVLLPSVAVYHQVDGEESTGGGYTSPPVAWAFLGPDASLMSLHVEEPYRGRGMAKAVASRMFNQGMDRYAADGIGHADVLTDNIQSIGVMKSLNGIGIEGFEVYWLHIDLARIYNRVE
ncbi:MAG: hypothetical protein M1819_002571 [Sarea resinae]|nr:MAG: hypothetical protein M1819_002571 [Sarea resinae]